MTLAPLGRPWHFDSGDTRGAAWSASCGNAVLPGAPSPPLPIHPAVLSVPGPCSPPHSLAMAHSSQCITLPSAYGPVSAPVGTQMASQEVHELRSQAA